MTLDPKNGKYLDKSQQNSLKKKKEYKMSYDGCSQSIMFLRHSTAEHILPGPAVEPTEDSEEPPEVPSPVEHIKCTSRGLLVQVMASSQER